MLSLHLFTFIYKYISVKINFPNKYTYIHVYYYLLSDSNSYHLSAYIYFLDQAFKTYDTSKLDPSQAIPTS